MFIFEISSQCMFIIEKPKVGKSTLQWMLLNMVDPTLSVCVETWWDCMYLGRKALVRMFEKYIHYIGCFVDNCFTTLNVCNQVQLLWLLLQVKHMYLYVYSCVPLLCVFFNHRFIYFACLTFTGIKLYVFPSRVRSLCVFIIENGYFVCLKKLSVPLWMFEIVNVYFVCLNYVWMFEIADSIINNT